MHHFIGLLIEIRILIITTLVAKSERRRSYRSRSFFAFSVALLLEDILEHDEERNPIVESTLSLREMYQRFSKMTTVHDECGCKKMYRSK
jgi:hypothetical protein